MNTIYQCVLLECAKTLGLDDAHSFADTGILELDGNAIHIEYLGVQNAQEYMMFYSKLGCPYEVNLALCTQLLEANMLWRETGGATLGLDSSSGNVFLAYQHRLDGLTGVDLAAMLTQFNQIALHWKKHI